MAASGPSSCLSLSLPPSPQPGRPSGRDAPSPPARWHRPAWKDSRLPSGEGERRAHREVWAAPDAPAAEAGADRGAAPASDCRCFVPGSAAGKGIGSSRGLIFFPRGWGRAVESCPAVPRLLSWEDRSRRAREVVVAFFWRNPGWGFAGYSGLPRKVFFILCCTGLAKERSAFKVLVGHKRVLKKLIASRCSFPHEWVCFKSHLLQISTCQSFHLFLTVHVHHK